MSTSVSKRPQELEAERPPDWSPLVQPATGDGRRALARIGLRAAVAVGVALVLWRLGHRLVAGTLLAVIVVVTAASLLFPSVATRIDQATAALQRVVGRGLALVLFGAVQLLVFAPLWLLFRMFRHDPLALGSSRDSATFWRPVRVRVGQPLYRRPFTYERVPAAAAGSLGRGLRLPAVIGLLVLVVLVDVGVGSIINRVWPEGTASLLGYPDAAAGRHEPWREALGQEITQVDARQRYDPYLGWKTSHFDGKYVHVAGGIRRSYEPAGSTAKDAIEVFFLGGSAMFGNFQRDEHTIPSEFARLADADGIRVRVVNYGRLGYTNWQEVLLLEQLVTGKSVPDLAVFYDGFNEILTQLYPGPHSEPTHIHAREFEDRLRLGHNDDPPPLSTLYDSWARRSALHRLVHALGPGAGGSQGSPSGAGVRRAQDSGRNAASIYARGVQIARRLAAGYGFRAGFFWQPSVYTKHLVSGEKQLVGAYGGNPGAWRRASEVARSRLEPPVSDLSTALDSVNVPVMYDDVHTNEFGAKVVARALYERLRPTLLRLSRKKHR